MQSHVFDFSHMTHFTVAFQVFFKCSAPQFGVTQARLLNRLLHERIGVTLSTITRLLKSPFKTEECRKQNLPALLDLPDWDHNRQTALPMIVTGDRPPKIPDREQREPEVWEDGGGATCFAAKQRK